MTANEILAMPASEYMGQAQLEFFEALLRQRLVEATQGIATAREALAGLGVASDSLDQASIEEDRQAIARTLERLNAQVVAIKSSLKAISDGDYGWCEATGEEIGLARLIAQPTARLSAPAQALYESVSRHYVAA